MLGTWMRLTVSLDVQNYYPLLDTLDLLDVSAGSYRLSRYICRTIETLQVGLRSYSLSISAALSY